MPLTRLFLARRHTAGAIYGTILAMAVVVGVGVDTHLGAGQATAELTVTVFVFWLAHVYARVVERHATAGHRGATDVLAAANEEMPILRAALPAVAVFALWWAGVLDRETAIWTALGIGLAELAVVGYVLGRRNGRSVRSSLLLAALDLCLGAILIALQAFFGH